VHIPAGRLTRQFLQLIDLVKRSSEIILTKRGKPTARLVPVDHPQPARLFGYLRGAATVVGDIARPIDEPWGADRP